LIEAEKILKKIDAIRVVHFSQVDVVRHPLVADVISAYASWDKRKNSNI
jgi:phosphate starvation-inducible protein PhoH and related proteins